MLNALIVTSLHQKYIYRSPKKVRCNSLIRLLISFGVNIKYSLIIQTFNDFLNLILYSMVDHMT